MTKNDEKQNASRFLVKDFKPLIISLIYFITGCIVYALINFAVSSISAKKPDFSLTSLLIGVICFLVTAVILYFFVIFLSKKLSSERDEQRKAAGLLEKIKSDLDNEKRKIDEFKIKLNENAVIFNTLFEQAPLGIALGNYDSGILSSRKGENINSEFYKIIGWTKEEFSRIGWDNISHPDDLETERSFFLSMSYGFINGFDMEKRFIKADGSYAWGHMIITAVKPDDIDNNYDYICLIKDITERKNTEHALCESERSKRVMLENLPGMAYRCDYREWTMSFVSEGCYALTGFKPESLIGNKSLSYYNLIAPEYRDAVKREYARIMKNKESFKSEYEIVTADGSRKWVLDKGKAVYDDNGGVSALEGIIIDITESKAKEIEIRYINEHDPVSGLYNRIYFENLLASEKEREYPGNRAIIVFNLRNFNYVNISFGYKYGNVLIKQIVELFKTFCNENLSLYQTHYSRFSFYLKGYTDKKDILNLCDSVYQALKLLIPVNAIGVRIGIIEIEGKDYDVGQVLKNLLIASENKSSNPEYPFYTFYDEKLEAKIMRKTDIINTLKEMSESEGNENFYLNFQPIVNLKTNKVQGFEALARLKTEKYGFIPPIEFIALAEENQYIVPLGKQIIDMSCRFLKKLELQGYKDIILSVNISVIQLIQADFVSDLTEILNRHKIDTSRFGIEITESFFTDNYRSINEKLGVLKDMGINIAIDDFGTGYSSLARESELNVNCLKIDKCFMDNIKDEKADKSITGDIISMAHKLGHAVIAEGVEWEEQKRYLISSNCDYAQGYLFSRPLSEDAAIDYLAAYNNN